MAHNLLNDIRTIVDGRAATAARRFVVRAPRGRIKREHRLNNKTKITAATLGVLAALGSVFAPTAPARAQDYPHKAIRMIVNAAPGGANDILGRLVARRMTESLGQAVIVDNRPGAGGSLGAETVAHASPDGYTLLNGTNAVVVNPSLNPDVSYALKELAPITQVANFPLVISVHPSVPANTMAELIALAKKRGGLNYGSTGTGSTNHLTGVLFNNVAGLNNVHVPYKGAGPLTNALLAGEVEIGITTVFSAAPYVRSGRFRAIAVTSPKPSASLPGVPTVASFYPGFDTNVWHGYFTAAGTPAPVIAILHREIVKALHSPEVREALENGGAELIGNTPAEFSAVVAADADKYAKLVKISGAKPD
jgi:tripartite-type tricarboxylate transporter receptor subunit TctC